MNTDFDKQMKIILTDNMQTYEEKVTEIKELIKKEVEEAEQRGAERVIGWVVKNTVFWKTSNKWQAFLKSIGVNSKEK